MKQYSFKINGRAYDVCVESVEGGSAKVSVNGVAYEVEIPESGAPAGRDVQAAVSVPSGNAAFTSAASPAQGSGSASVAPSQETASPSQGSGKPVTAPMPGVIIDVCVKEGQAVRRGAKVAVLEAMKMENEILAESDGTVTDVFVGKGDSVLEGAKIVAIG